MSSTNDCATPCLIWNPDRRQWWAPNERGYTDNILCAGVYPREHAERCARGDRVVALSEALERYRAAGTLLEYFESKRLRAAEWLVEEVRG